MYYHLFLNEHDIQYLSHQAKKLLQLSDSLETWNAGIYGNTIQFCNKSTLQSLASVWETYCWLDLSDSERAFSTQRLKDQVQKTQQISKEYYGKANTDLTVVRSAAPLSLEALMKMPNSYDYFWKHGTFSEDSDVLQSTKLPNPMVASSWTMSSLLHYGLNPLMGYHLATAYAPLQKNSKFYERKEGKSHLGSAFQAARAQLHSWAVIFRSRVSSIAIRVFVSDAFTACDSLRKKEAKNSSSTRLDPLCENTPTAFDIIDTSNLADSLGALGLLVAAVPLLRKGSDAALYTESLVKQGKDLATAMSELLRGDLVTTAFFLGVLPFEYWSNASLIAPEEAIFQLMMGARSKKKSNGQEYCRLLWKPILSGSQNDQTFIISVPSDQVAQFLYTTYLNMFAHEDVMQSLQRLSTDTGGLPQRLITPIYNRGSFVYLLSFLQTRISTNWHAAVSSLIDMVENDRSLMIGLNYLQELYAALHVHQLYSPQVLQDPRAAGHSAVPTTLKSWKSLPSVLYVTLKVPRSRLKVFTDLSSRPHDLGTPFVHASVASGPTYKGPPWQNLFAAVQLCFGELRTNSQEDKLGSSLHVDIDVNAWEGESPLLVSFLVPTWILLQDSDETNVSLAVQGSMNASTAVRSKLPMDLTIHKTKLGNGDEVSLSKFPPSLSSPLPGRYLVSTLLKKKDTMLTPETPLQSVSATIGSSKLKTVTRRLDLVAGPALDALRAQAEVQTSQKGPFTIAIDVKTDTKRHAHELSFPIPVSHSNIKTRIARKSAYIELITVIDMNQNMNELRDSLITAFSFNQKPTLLNTPHIDLDLQPAIDINQKIPWLNLHVSVQMSEKEHFLREKFMRLPQSCPSPRVNLKDSIFSMFMHYSGLQGEKAEIFGLSTPQDDGVSVLLFVSALRIDLGNHTAMLDTAVVPLTHEIVPALGPALQQLVSSGKLCQVKVDIEERKLWRQLLPVCVERCRTWSHTNNCEYKKKRGFLEKERHLICSCGKGLLSKDYMPNLPQWKHAKKYAVRAVISPLYPVPYVEKLYVEGYLPAQPGSSSVQNRPTKEDTCANCGVDHSEGVETLLRCGRCKAVQYCSKTCQKAHWSAHKKHCKSSES